MSKKRFLLFLFLISFFFFFLFYQNLFLKLPSKKEKIIFYSNQTRDDLKKIIIKSIKKTKKSLFLVMYSLIDKDVIKNINKLNPKINIKIFYGKKGTYKKPNILKENVFAYKSKGLMHQKILIIDKKLIFLGSCNFTKYAFDMDNNLIIGLYSKEIADFLIKNSPLNPKSKKFLIDKNILNIYLLPDKKNITIKKIIKLIENAKSSIKIAMYTFTHPLIEKKLIEAKKKGINISIIIDKKTSYGASKKLFKNLKKANINIKKSKNIELLHHKYIIIDDKILITGSANLTKNAFLKNEDIILIFNKLSKKHQKSLKNLHKIIEHDSSF